MIKFKYKRYFEHFKNKFILKYILTILLILFIFLNFYVPSFAYGSEVKFEHINLEDEMVKSPVTHIYQDSRGFMWFATNEGLARYDGYSFFVYRNQKKKNQSISDNRVSSIVEDGLGYLWVGTKDGVLQKLDLATGEFQKFYRNNNNAVNCLFSEKKDNIIWIGTTNGLVKLDVNKNEFNDFVFEGVYSIIKLDEEYLLLGTENGLAKYRVSDAYTERFENYQNAPKKVNCLFKDSNNVIWIGSEEGLYKWDIRTNDKEFVRYKNNLDSSSSLSYNNVVAICEDEAGDILCGTLGGGLNRLDKKYGTFYVYQYNSNNYFGISSNEVWSLYKDKTGIIWIGSSNGVVNKIVHINNLFSHYKKNSDISNTLIDNKITSFYEDSRQNLWIGTTTGLDLYEKTKGIHVHYVNDINDKNSISNNIITSICEDKYGNIWVGTKNGLNKFDRESKKFKRFYSNSNEIGSISNNIITSIFVQKDSSLWIGTYDGLNEYDYTTEKFKVYKKNLLSNESISNNRIHEIVEDNNGTLWIGTDEGLNKFDKNTGIFKRYLLDNTVSRCVMCITCDNQNNIWFGTYMGGICKLEPSTNKISVFTQKDGLSSNLVYGIIEHDNILWISTNIGISRYDINNGKFTKYNVNHGLQRNEFNEGAYYKSKNGEIYFGGDNGYNAFIPEKIIEYENKINTYIPDIAITSLSKFDTKERIDNSFYRTNRIVLSYKDIVCSFDIALLEYTNPDKNRFYYMLEGFDTDWIDSGTRHYLSYTNLPGGKYKLKIKAVNSLGIKYDKEFSIDIIVETAPWKTWWAYILYVFIAVLAVYKFIKIKTDNHKKQLEKLDATVKERTSELTATLEVVKNTQQQLIERERLASLGQLAGGIAHEINTPLGSLKNYLTGLIKLIERYRREFSDNTNISYKELDEMLNKLLSYLNKMDQSCEYMAKVIKSVKEHTRNYANNDIREHTFSVNKVIEEIKLLMAHELKHNNIELVINVEEDLIVKGDQSKLSQVFANLISNSIQAYEGLPGGKIEIFARSVEQKISITLKDYGKGIPDEIKERLFKEMLTTKVTGTGIGIFLSNSIITGHFQGKIWFESEKYKGTTFFIEIPKAEIEKSKENNVIFPVSIGGEHKS